MVQQRNLELAVISDTHLGTYGCQAKELLKYLKSINPETLILNGDIVDIWQFSKRYWPNSHMQVLQELFEKINNGTKVIYIPGNHDEMMRKFLGFSLGSFEIANKKVLDLDGKKAWFFHGDVFDITMQHSRWLAKLGAIGYDTLIIINTIANKISQAMGKGKISLSKKIKDNVKGAIKFINNFEDTASQIAIENGYDYVVCGHIHKPEIKTFLGNGGHVNYLNSGDWIENLTALEYNDKEWKIYHYHEDEIAPKIDLKGLKMYKNKDLFQQMVNEFKLDKKQKIS